MENKKEALDLNTDHPALAIFGHLGQLTERVTNALKENNIHSVLIHRAFTTNGHLCK